MVGLVCWYWLVGCVCGFTVVCVVALFVFAFGSLYDV